MSIMSNSTTSHILLATMALVVLVTAVSCRTVRKDGTQDGPPREPGLNMGTFQPPSIQPPAPQKRRPLKLDAEALPGDVRARLPEYDGGTLFVTVPATMRDEVLAEDVFRELIQPILRTLGFEEGRDRFRMPPSAGVPMRRADLKSLVDAVEKEYEVAPELLRSKTQKMIDAMAGRIQADEELDRALQMGEGMSFSQYVAGIERLQIQYPFLQVEGDVPIEHTLLLATRWEGQNVTAIRGRVLVSYRVVNQTAFSANETQDRAARALGKLPGVRPVSQRYDAQDERARPHSSRVRRGAEDRPVLVLLPYGTDADGTTRLRYAYRMIVPGEYQGQLGAFQIWLDASTGEILQLIPLIQDAGARGEVYRRGPDIGVMDLTFVVDNAVGGQYTLQEADTVARVDFEGDGYNATDVSIADDSGNSTPTFADFDQNPLNQEADALCRAGTNEAFQQISAYGWLNRYIKRARGLGVFLPFPRLGALGVTIEWDACNGWNDGFDNLTFGYCAGYTAVGCPDAFTAGADWFAELLSNSLATAQDNTWLAHELAHSLTPRLTNLRPADWCGAPFDTFGLEYPARLGRLLGRSLREHQLLVRMVRQEHRFGVRQPELRHQS